MFAIQIPYVYDKSYNWFTTKGTAKGKVNLGDDTNGERQNRAGFNLKLRTILDPI